MPLCHHRRGHSLCTAQASDASLASSRQLRDLERAVKDAVARSDYASAERALASLKAASNTGAKTTTATTKLRLMPVGGGKAVELTAVNVTEWDALFVLPAALATGGYTAAISNGLKTTTNDGWVGVEYFASPSVRGSPGRVGAARLVPTRNAHSLLLVPRSTIRIRPRLSRSAD